jgi:hypothetical protein
MRIEAKRIAQLAASRNGALGWLGIVPSVLIFLELFIADLFTSVVLLLSCAAAINEINRTKSIAIDAKNAHRFSELFALRAVRNPPNSIFIYKI